MTASKKIPWQARQGDVLLMEVDAIPDGAVLDKGSPDEVTILAEGEATGHHHAFFGPEVTKYVADAARGGGTYVMLKTEKPLKHQEHTVIPTPVGPKKVVRQCVFDILLGVKRVTD